MKNNNLNIIANELVSRGLANVESIKKTISQGKRLPFMTFKEWKDCGYQVQKGEKALFSCVIWVRPQKKDENGNIVLAHDKNNGFIKQKAYFFGAKQVKKIEDSQLESVEEKKKTKANDHVEEGKVYTVSYEKKSKKTTSKTKKKEAKKQVVKTKKSEPKKAAPKKATKQLATKVSSNIEKHVENGVEFMLITLERDGNFFASAKLPTSEYNAMKDTEKKRFNRVWGIA